MRLTKMRALRTAIWAGVLLTTLAAAPAATQAPSGVRMVPPPNDGERFWPRWRGPSGQGVVEDGGYVDTWSETTNVRWRTPVPGSGHSSPIVWGDRIFLTTSHDRATSPRFQ